MFTAPCPKMCDGDTFFYNYYLEILNAERVHSALLVACLFEIAICTRRKRVSSKFYSTSLFLTVTPLTLIFYLQLLLEYDELSWKEREWFSVYSPNAASNFPQYEVDQKQLNL